MLRVGAVLGFWPTIGIVLTTAMLGAYLAKREGLRVIREWQAAVGEARMPEGGIVSGLLVLVGAVLLVTPGVLTDLVGLSLLLPWTRGLLVRFVEERLQARIERGEVSFASFGPRGATNRVDLGGFDIDALRGFRGRAESASASSSDASSSTDKHRVPRGGGAVFDVRVVTPHGVYARRVVRNASESRAGAESRGAIRVEDLGWARREPKIIEAEVIESETHRLDEDSRS